MKCRLAVLALACILLAVPVAVQAEATKTEAVQFPNGKDMGSGFVATPEKAGRYPGVLVIPEWWGLNDWVKEQTQKLAEQGFVALAVDLYNGKVATDDSQAAALLESVTQEKALAELTAAYDYLNTRKDVTRDRTGALGWGTGASYVLRLAMRESRMAACVVNYGALPTDPNDILLIFGAVLGNFGGNDRGITPADAQAFEKTMTSQGKRVDIKIYDDAGHGFENPANTDTYQPDDAADAWARSVKFLSKMLK